MDTCPRLRRCTRGRLSSTWCPSRPSKDPKKQVYVQSGEDPLGQEDGDENDETQLLHHISLPFSYIVVGTPMTRLPSVIVAQPNMRSSNLRGTEVHTALVSFLTASPPGYLRV